jgi:26S proteasome regulatory subunit N5
MEVAAPQGSDTEAQAFAARQQRALESCILFLLASKFDNHQSDMMHRLKTQLPVLFKTVPIDTLYANVLMLFTTHEIVSTPFAGQAILESHSALARSEHMSEETAAFFVKQLRDRVVQHNLRVVARYYTRIHSLRLAALLGLSYDELEVHLSDIASGGDLYVKIDRPAGVVCFHERPQPEQVLSDWASDVGKMLQLMEATCHIINRENMVYKV